MDLVSASRFIFAFAFIIGLILLLAFLIRKLGWDKKWQGMNRRENRLGVEASLMLDSKHRLVLVRRDNTSHLLLLGAASCQVVERDIPLLPKRLASQKEINAA